MADALRLFEEACRNFEEGAAQRFLADFPKRSDAVWVTQQLLTLPPGAETQLLQFQAAVALRQSILSTWSGMHEGQREALQTFVVHAILRFVNVSEAQGATIGLLCGLAAILLKLRWTVANARTQFMNGVMQWIQGEGEIAAKYAGVLMVQAVVEEFNGATATPLGLSVDYHKQCSAGFQKQYLRACFVEFVGLAALLVRHGAWKERDGAALCFACLKAMNSVLSWDFEQSTRLGPKSSGGYSSQLRSTQETVKLEASWMDILADERLMDWLPALLAPSTETPNAFAESAAHVEAAEQFLLNLCSVRTTAAQPQTAGSLTSLLANEVFFEEADAKSAFLRHLLRLLLALLPSKTACVGLPEQMALAAKAFEALSRRRSCSEILSSAAELSSGQRLLDSLSFALNALLDAGSMSPDRQDTLEQESCLRLLYIWQRFCMPEVYRIYKGVFDVSLGEGVIECASEIFRHIVASELSLAAANASFDEDHAMDEDDVLEAYAGIARASVSQTFEFLAAQLDGRRHALVHIAQTGGSLPPTGLEEIAFLTELSGFVLADDVEGEVPSAPLQVAEFSRGVAHVEDDVVVKLSRSLLNVAGLIVNPSTQLLLSERVVECVMLALARWTETYLVPCDSTAATLAQVFGDNAKGQTVVQQLCGVANTCLTVFPSDQRLQEVVCRRFLRALTRSEQIRKHVAASPSWSELLSAFSKLHPVFQQMQPKMARHIASALCRVSDALDDDVQRRCYLMAFLDRVQGEVQRLGYGEDNVLQALLILEILRGMTAAAGDSTEARPLLYRFFDSLLHPLLKMIALYEADDRFACSVLKLAAEVVHVHILLLKEGEAERLLQWALELLRIFSDHRRGVRRIEVSEVLQKETEHEQCKDIRAMLLLLKNITDRELAPEESQTYLDIAQIVLRGMDMAIPLMTTEMLKFPKLCFQYFDLLSHLCEIYPEKVLSLAHPSLQTLLTTLAFGLTLPETRALRIVLESLESLAKCLWEPKKSSNPLSITLGERSFGSAFIEAILKRLLSGDEGGDAVNASSASLLYLFLHEGPSVEPLLRSIIFSIGSYPSVDADIQKLLQSANQDASTMQMHEHFRDRLFTFVKNVRHFTKLL